MPLFPASPDQGNVPVFNSACPWSSSLDELTALYTSPYTSAVTTRTSTLNGFADDSTKHQVAFFGHNAQSSANSYGYSPYPLTQYMDWIASLVLSESLPKKQVIVSITGNLEETAQMLGDLQLFADKLNVVVAVEFNASCPNIPGHPPSAYVEEELRQYISLLSNHSSPTLKVGIKLPPYTYDAQFDAVIRALSASSPSSGDHPISFLAATNTLGQGLVYEEQIAEMSSFVAQKRKNDVFALPGGYGGLAGAALHQLALGNVFRLTTMLRADQQLSSISVIGIGGVHDVASVERMRLAGATAVACATALGREGVEVFAKLVSIKAGAVAGAFAPEARARL